MNADVVENSVGSSGVDTKSCSATASEAEIPKIFLGASSSM